MSASGNLFSLLDPAFENADRPFIIRPDGSTITYGNLREQTGRFANLLAAKGVKPGDRVAVQVEKSPEALALYLACVRAGAAFLPLNTGYTVSELEYFIGDARPSMIVCSPARHEALSTIGEREGCLSTETIDEHGEGSFLQAATAMPAEFETLSCSGDTLAAILYTSGTTGRSKGTMLTHDNLVSNALTLVDYWQFTSDDVLLHALPIFHTHGLFVATNVMLFARGTMLFLPKFDTEKIREALPNATAMMGVPTFYTRLLGEPWLDRAATAHMRLFISGSAPLLAETHRQWTERTGHRILERYGMTETNMITSNPYDGDRVPGSVGFALPDVAVRVTDPETGALLPADEIGMIEVKGPNVFKGYWQMPEKTHSEFREDGFFITGDLGTMDEDGRVTLVGRGKDLIISGGFNVYPKEIESAIDALEGVEESAVIGVPHPDFGEGVTAVVVRTAAAGTVEERHIVDQLREHLASFKLPKRVVFVPALPRNTMGKVLKGELRTQYRDLYRPGGAERPA
ncbi:MAG: malonyl-CoA synthase [Rhizobiaceae bacterium]|nr:malonyl-CoA synthase [Rhizobiaceae bacterium]